MTGRDHGRSRYKHGPDQNGTEGKGCRCTDCTAANSAYETNRVRQTAYGRWQPYVDARPAREHLRMLSASGIGWRQVAELTGLSSSTVNRLLYNGRRPPTKGIRAETEAKILAVRPGLHALGGCATVGSTGTRRRLQALVAVGYSQTEMARRLGVARSTMTLLMRGNPVLASTARATAVLYDQLWNVPPDQSSRRAKESVTKALRYAASAGWPPPLAWDDDQIDDPAATPAEGWRRPKRMPLAERAAAVRELIQLEGGDRNLAADRAGVSRATLDKVIERAGKAS